MKDLLPPDVRSRLQGLRILSRRASGLQGIGLHASHSRGAGLEFAQYRAYERGDELRQIDWKLYARSDKFFVREAERESPVAIWIMIDISASMTQRNRNWNGCSRLDAAKAMAMATAELAMQQGDRFGLIAIGDGGLHLVPPGAGLRQRNRLNSALATLAPARGFAEMYQLSPIWERVGKRDLVLFLSDCFDESAVSLVERLAAAGRETFLIEMLTVEERDFPFDQGYRFVDPETGEELLADGRALRARFLDRFGQARQSLHQRLDHVGVRHVTHVLDEPVDLPLRRLFAISGGRP